MKVWHFHGALVLYENGKLIEKREHSVYKSSLSEPVVLLKDALYWVWALNKTIDRKRYTPDTLRELDAILTLCSQSTQSKQSQTEDAPAL